MSFHVISFHAIHFISCHFMSFHVISCHFMSFHVMSFHVISCHFIHCIFLSLQASFHFSQFTKIPISFLLPMVSSCLVSFRKLPPRRVPSTRQNRHIRTSVLARSVESSLWHVGVELCCFTQTARASLFNNHLTRQCSAHPSVCLGKLLCKCNVLVGGSNKWIQR